jgi:hypothetical protein
MAPYSQAQKRHRTISASTKRFVRHYVEMVVAMFVGMGVLMAPAGWALGALDTSWSELHYDAPALMLLAMAVTMTAPMVGWMRYRGHGWQANTEMSAAMFVPTFAVIALLWGGLVEDVGVLLLIEHVAMLVGMAAAMLLRRAEYSGAAHHRGQVEQVTA